MVTKKLDERAELSRKALWSQSPAERVKAFSQNNAISGFDFQEADDALEPLHVGDDVEVVQQLVVVEVLCLQE